MNKQFEDLEMSDNKNAFDNYDDDEENEEEEEDGDFDANELLNLTDYQNKRKDSNSKQVAPPVKLHNANNNI